MAGIYIHIPFCKQACVYCNFHFSTSTQLKNDFLQALLKEISARKDYLQGESIETIYFGGGSPSLLSQDEIEIILNEINKKFVVESPAEITLEANPDDINKEKALAWKRLGVNRLSLGVQSFYDDDLKWMNRAHTAQQSVNSIEMVREAGFSNLTIDLIYGTPTLSDEKWKSNVDRAIQLDIPHLSCYALTVEPRTALENLIRTGKVLDVSTDDQARQFLLLIDWLEGNGYEHYEISNFSKPGMKSRHNTSYWQQKSYLGLGPSAHSFNGISRQWNISNNALYISSITNSVPAFEIEHLGPIHRLNEYIMTSLRTSEGLNLEFLSREFGEGVMSKCLESSSRHQHNGSIIYERETIRLTKKGKLLADGIAADLFFEKL
ncbi:MAG TPA: radical SAM family heme chaperone HemW [Chitinophagaceae bacterium]|nr:radical SAM family heme chaperone HemW [Chitinophagaceae bacterium]